MLMVAIITAMLASIHCGIVLAWLSIKVPYTPHSSPHPSISKAVIGFPSSFFFFAGLDFAIS